MRVHQMTRSVSAQQANGNREHLQATVNQNHNANFVTGRPRQRRMGVLLPALLTPLVSVSDDFWSKSRR